MTECDPKIYYHNLNQTFIPYFQRTMKIILISSSLLIILYLEAYLNVRGVERRQRTRHILGVM